MNILVVEDNLDLSANLADILTMQGYQVDFAYNGVSALNLALENDYDLILLDLNLPKKDGISVCKEILEVKQPMILMLTARVQIEEKLEGFSAGAWDYLCKPFSVKELLARIEALQLRVNNNQKELKCGPIKIDKQNKQVWREEMLIHLTPIGYQILCKLMNNYGTYVSKKSIADSIWSDGEYNSDTLKAHLYQLRQAIDKPFDQELIVTKAKVGVGIFV